DSTATAQATVTITINAAAAPTLSTTSETIEATEGTAITALTITAQEALTWTADSSTLPSGITGTAADDNKSFTISGTPKAGTAGTYSYTVTAKNSLGKTTAAAITIKVNQAPAPQLTASATSINATEGRQITTITVTANEDVTWTSDGTLPSGITGTSSGRTFTIAGAPALGSAKTEAYSYTVTAKNALEVTESSTITITVSEAAELIDITATTITATEGEAIDPVTIKSAAGNVLTWTTSGDLPSGLIGAAATDNKSFTISGTPATGTEGSYTYVITAKNSDGESATATITVKVNAALTAPVFDITAKSITATEGEAIESLTVTATAGTDLTWTTSGDLPSGLTGVKSGDTAFTISGTPATGTAGSYTCTVIATNTAGSAQSVIKITVTAKESESETTAYAPILSSTDMKITATEGEAITSLTITAISGDNLAWSTTGSLPTGLTGAAAANKLSFTISGTPASGTANSYTYRVTARNDAGSATARVSVTVERRSGSGGDTINNEVTNGLDNLSQTGESMTLEDALKNQLGFSTGELRQVTEITIPENITDLGDLTALLPNLQKIDLTNANGLETVDLTGNSSVKEITMTGNTTVKTLDLTDSGVTKIDASGCTALENVNVAGNKILEELLIDECTNVTSLNVAGCTNLKILSLSDCGGVSELNVDGCENLEDLSFNGNALKRFDGRGLAKLRQTKKLNAYGQRVGDTKLTRTFNFIDFFLNMLFNSQVSISGITVDISEDGDKNVKNIIARDSSGNKIATTTAYDPATGEVVFAAIPASIEYDYDTGIDSPDSMDISISGEAFDGGENISLGGGGGGCSTGFASLALLALAGFVFRNRH
ncbi:MAG: putative Ig domain-containing protein, partial [Synergistaceae bacterium]|nr:putative Ig domain-containing protein [Synergistaceae bacterium]